MKPGSRITSLSFKKEGRKFRDDQVRGRKKVSHHLSLKGHGSLQSSDYAVKPGEMLPVFSERPAQSSERGLSKKNENGFS